MKLLDLFESSQFNDAIERVRTVLRHKYGQPIGLGRNREVYGTSRVVFKLPSNEYGLHDNHSELEQFKRSEGEERETLAKCKIVHIGGLPVLVMERLRMPEKTEREDFPWWVDFVDCQQVGFDRCNRLKAYDYAFTTLTA